VSRLTGGILRLLFTHRKVSRLASPWEKAGNHRGREEVPDRDGFSLGLDGMISVQPGLTGLRSQTVFSAVNQSLVLSSNTQVWTQRVSVARVKQGAETGSQNQGARITEQGPGFLRIDQRASVCPNSEA
jgi:hypothetical protein